MISGAILTEELKLFVYVIILSSVENKKSFSLKYIRVIKQ